MVKMKLTCLVMNQRSWRGYENAKNLNKIIQNFEVSFVLLEVFLNYEKDKRFKIILFWEIRVSGTGSKLHFVPQSFKIIWLYIWLKYIQS